MTRRQYFLGLLLLTLAGALVRWWAAGDPLAAGTALLVPGVGLLAGRAYGQRAALLAALLAALHPLSVLLSALPPPDAGYMVFLTWTLVLAQHAVEDDHPTWIWAICAGLCAAVTGLTRAEGLVAAGALALALAILPRPAGHDGWGARLKGGVLFSGAVLVGVLPAVSGLSSRLDTESLTQFLSERLALLTPELFLERQVDMLRFTIEALGPAALLLLAGGVLLVLRAPAGGTSDRSVEAGEGRRLRFLSFSVGFALLLVFLLVRVDMRFGCQLAVLALPHLGAVAAFAIRDLSPRMPGRAPLVLATTLALLSLGLLFVGVSSS